MSSYNLILYDCIMLLSELCKTGNIWSQMSVHTYIPWSLKLFLENVMSGSCEKE